MLGVGRGELSVGRSKLGEHRTSNGAGSTFGAEPAPPARLDARRGIGILDRVKIVDTNQLPEESWSSPKGKYAGAGKQVSEALGRNPQSTDLRERHPFDIEICRIPAGKIAYPFHSHSAQWEFYHVISGRGQVRHSEGTSAIQPGDAFLFEPGQPHQLINDSPEDLVVYVVADNPIGETCHYPDSGKWLVRSPERRLIRSEPVPYFDGEE